MLAFARLYTRLDSTTKTSRKLEALADYFAGADPADAAWAVFFLCGRRLKRLLIGRLLRDWGAEAAGIPGWLFDESYSAVGDLAETLSLLLPCCPTPSAIPLHQCVEERILPLPRLSEAEQRRTIVDAWNSFDRAQRLAFNKLITGEFRVGVSQQMVIRALAEVSQQSVAAVAHRLMGDWQPSPEFYQRLVSPQAASEEISRPYPFLLAHPLEGDPASLGAIADWLLEWKWDGIRAQLLRRPTDTFLWSRGEELITERFPEIVQRASRIPAGTVLDGEILAWRDGHVLPFGALQRRIGRKNLGRRILAEVPVCFLAFDLLESEGRDIRAWPLDQRRDALERLWSERGLKEPLVLSELIHAPGWPELAKRRQESRVRNVEGIMLKARHSSYATGRPRGVWWKWKIEPHTVDAVMIYAQLGHGRRASLFTDYTFGLWHEGELVPFAKAYSGLSDDEIRQVDLWVRRHTLERHGPVRRVEPALVFEIAFEAIQSSTRHRSGIAVRFPRIARWRHDKKPQDADHLVTLADLIKGKSTAKNEPGPTLFD